MDKFGFGRTQTTDTANPSGILHQKIQLLFSEFDNQQRRQRVIAGMTEKCKQCIWVVKPPQGYDIIKINGKRSIVLNDKGKKITKGFEWKAMEMKNEEIVLKLQKMGLKIYKQKIHTIFKNPFYCGLLCQRMPHGNVVKGKHPAMVSQEPFMKENDIISQSTRSEVPHLKENENLLMKIFIKCDHCGSPFTGYLMKARGIYYYKCRQKGCTSNKSAKLMNEMFMNLLGKYTLKESHLKLCRFHLEHLFASVAQEQVSMEKALKSNLTEVTKKTRKN